MAAPPCAKCIKARPGQRVVRGPDWCDGNHDGGSNYVGTIVSVHQPGTGFGYTTHPVEVQWDAEPVACYMSSCREDMCTLRLIDAGPAGVIFPNTTCGSCETKDVAGTLWKCAVCSHYSLCHSCYMNDKHNTEHEFLRYDDPGSAGFRVPSRKTSTKVPFYGIFPGAEVQSRTENKTGIVRNVRGEARLLRKTDAGKLCSSNTGKVDDSLKFVKAAQGGYYYRDHMPVIASPGHDPKDINLFDKNKKTMSVCDCVRVISNKGKLQSFQKKLYQNCTSADIKRWCGTVGMVVRVNTDGWFYISSWDARWFHGECLIPTSNTPRSTISRDISTGSKGLGYGPSQMTALHFACYSGKEDVVRTLVLAGAAVEEADRNGDRALHYAAAREDSKIIELLISAGANMGACNNFNETALHVAIKENSVRCARVLANNINDSDINIQDNVGDTVLHSALNAGMQDVSSVLLQQPRVNVGIKNDEGEIPLHVAVAKDNLRATQKILQISTGIADTKTNTNVTALYIAAEKNLYQIAKALVTQGHCNLDIECGTDLKTALAAAVARGCGETVQLLVESGADVNKPDCEGNAPLHICATNTQPLILHNPSLAPKLSMMMKNCQDASSQRRLSGLALAGLLASKGADLQQKNKEGRTPPQLCDSTALVEMLLLWNMQESATGRYREQLSGLVNAKDENGMTLLHREALDGRYHVARMLLAQELVSADDVRSKDLKTALLIAAECGNCNLVEVLVEAGADVNKQDANRNTPLHLSLKSRSAVKPSDISSTVAPKMKAIASELQKVNPGDIDSTLALACFLISSGSSLKIKNSQGLDPLGLSLSMPVIRELMKWAPKTREPSAQEPSVQRRAGNDTAAAEGAPASSTESISAPGPSDEEANCRSAKKKPKEEEIDYFRTCAICMEKPRMMAFPCKHGMCQECATKNKHCHICREPLKKKIKLYEG